jgi:arylsulfatase
MTDVPLSMAETPPGPSESTYRAGAPNVLVIVLDDLGFAQLGCYGSDLATPNLDRLAARGLRFTNFHTTAVCSPTRACLLTGRNHHRVGMGMLPDLPADFPAYRGRFPASAATAAHVLRAEGWATMAIGKWHLVPRDQRAVGPFDMWPLGCGFDTYYGFLNGETNQWTPNLVRDNTHVEPPATPAEGYHLDADLADEAIRRLREHRLTHPDRPFFCWYATAAPHAPHQAPAEWIDRFRGRFDEGWDVWRERALARQIELGIVPAATELSARPEWVEAWTDLDDDRRRLYARMMEVFAGFLAHADHQIGRVLDALEEQGDFDDTVVVVVSDNGCSAEGGPNGSWNQLGHYLSDAEDDLDDELAHMDDLGGHHSSGHYPWGWALAGNTPLRRWKRYTHEGGVRDPMIVSWPAGLGPEVEGGLRHQYSHAVDVWPTILDCLGLDAPQTVAGVEQMSLDGVSLRPVLSDADAPAVRQSQYFECWGSRAMYHDGWKVVTDHVNQLTAAERDLITGSHDFGADRWALFDTRTDFTESVDLAAAEPQRLAGLVERWHEAATRNEVLPIDDGRDHRLAHMYLPWMTFRSRFELRPGDTLHEVNGPMLWGGFRMEAAFASPIGPDASGVLCEQGDWISGWAWYLADGELRWVHVGKAVDDRVVAPVPAGVSSLAVAAEPRPEGGFTAVLLADGEEIGTGALDHDFPQAWSPDGSFLLVGESRPFPVTDDYAPPAPAPVALRAVAIDTAPADGSVRLIDEVDAVLRHQ